MNKKFKPKKILVISESKHGSTSGIADFISEKLLMRGYNVELKNVADDVDFTCYDGVVIGSAIRYDTWMPNARKLIMENQNVLCKIPVAYFLVCLALSRKSDKTIQQAIGYSDKLQLIAPLIKPVSIGRFAGALNYSKMSSLSRILAKIFFAFLRVKEGDYRDWVEIDNWVNSIEFD